ncbi:MAG: DUF2917 domain-containing protein [Burkholderiaceae bacterium]|nr:DUF2917 domain-containing protein [Burkholderiaceae bacterium]
MSKTPAVCTTAALARKQFLWLRGAGPATIACQSGTLWITEDGSPDDVILEAGQRHAVLGRAPVLIEALAESTAVIEALGALAWSGGASAPARVARQAGGQGRFGAALSPASGARIDVGGLMTSVASGRSSAWRELETGACR